MTVIGARPQFIKAAAVSRVLLEYSSVEELVVHTGQHYDDAMSEVFFRELDLPMPRYSLGVGSAPHAVQTGRMMEALDEVMAREVPDRVLVYGDTNSTLAGGLVAAKRSIPVVHVEAGLRSFNRAMPEELNRVVVDHLSTQLFAPTRVAVENLAREGIDGDAVQLVGDVMFDAALHFGRVAQRVSTLNERLGLTAGEYVLATVHRQENTDDEARLRCIADALRLVAERWEVVLPLHPRTRAAFERAGLLDGVGAALTVIEPVGYLDMLALEQRAAAVITDSGGVQKEAYFCRVPCLTLRAETEWVELVELGWNRLVPLANPADLVVELEWSVGRSGDQTQWPYGRGDSAERVAEGIVGAV